MIQYFVVLNYASPDVNQTLPIKLNEAAKCFFQKFNCMSVQFICFLAGAVSPPSTKTFNFSQLSLLEYEIKPKACSE